MNQQLLIRQFKTLLNTKKLSFIILLISLLLGTIFLILWQMRPEYSVLFNDLDNADVSQIIQQLESRNINYKVKDSGKSILVNKSSVEKLRLQLMTDGLKLHSIGFEIFDRSDFGMTEFSQKINYKRALQGELERTIASLNEIKSARVHLVLPEKRLFSGDIKPSAAVTLHLKTNQKLSYKQISGIQQLIAASVRNLSLKNIVIIDEKGNTLSKNPEENDLSTYLQTKKELEDYLTTKATKLLKSVFKQQAVTINIDAAISFDKIESSSFNYLPNDNGLITHIKEIKHLKNNKTQGPISDITSEKTYKYGHEIEKKQIAPGKIKHLTVSVIVPESTSYSMQFAIKNLVKNAIGFDKKRGDEITVAAIAKVKLSSHLPKIIMPIAKKITKKNELPPFFIPIALTIIASIVLIIILWQYRISKRRNLLLNELTVCFKNYESSTQ